MYKLIKKIVLYKKFGIIIVLVLCCLKMVARLQNIILDCTLGVTSEYVPFIQ